MLLLFKRMPFVGVILGVVLLIWGVTSHAVILDVIGGVVTVVSVVRTVVGLRERR
jgi:uncharacterized membrane protein HdeD (DUF308 family)